mgnify:CR=1 FL=1
MTDRSREALLAFLDWMAAKGLMARTTAQTRKASANKVLAILEAEEAQDVTQLELDEVMTRFVNLNRADYSPESLKAYKSRVSKAISDFSAYLANPMEFKPGTVGRAGKSIKKSEKSGGKPPMSAVVSRSSRQSPDQTETPSYGTPSSTNILPIPIRPDLTVRVQGLPFDLTQAEARRIANVVMAMAIEPIEGE